MPIFDFQIEISGYVPTLFYKTGGHFFQFFKTISTIWRQETILRPTQQNSQIFDFGWSLNDTLGSRGNCRHARSVRGSGECFANHAASLNCLPACGGSAATTWSARLIRRMANTWFQVSVTSSEILPKKVFCVGKKMLTRLKHFE